MPTLQFKDLQVNYFDQNMDSEEAILFIHGNSQSLKSFRYQLHAKSFSSFRLIAVDLPGHGLSDPSPDYNISLFVEVIEALITKLGIKKFILVGHSLGGHIALHSLQRLSPEGILVFGAPPLKKPLDMSAFRENENLPLLFKNDLSEKNIRDLISLFYSEQTIPHEDIFDIKSTDFNFRESMSKSFSEGKFQDETQLLQKFEGSKAILVGEHDSLVNNEYILKNVDSEHIFTLSSAHNMHIEDYALFNEFLLRFATKSLRKAPSRTFLNSTIELPNDI